MSVQTVIKNKIEYVFSLQNWFFLPHNIAIPWQP